MPSWFDYVPALSGTLPPACRSGSIGLRLWNTPHRRLCGRFAARAARRLSRRAAISARRAADQAVLALPGARFAGAARPSSPTTMRTARRASATASAGHCPPGRAAGCSPSEIFLMVGRARQPRRQILRAAPHHHHRSPGASVWTDADGDGRFHWHVGDPETRLILGAARKGLPMAESVSHPHAVGLFGVRRSRAT